MRQRHDYAPPGHQLALALSKVTQWKPFKFLEGTKDEILIKPMTPEQLHNDFGVGSRRVRKHCTRPKFGGSVPTPAKGKKR